MKLHTFPPGSFTRRVGIYASLKGIADKLEEVHYNLFDKAKQSEEFRKLNPGHGLPFLVTDDGQKVFESISIINYLEDLYPDPPMRGYSEYDRRVIDTHVMLGDHFFYALQMSSYHTIPYLSRLSAIQSHDVDMVTGPFWRMHLEQVSTLMGGNKFLAGSAPTIADCVLFPIFDYMRLYGWVIPYHLHGLRAWFERFADLPGVGRCELPSNFAENLIAFGGSRV